MLFKNHSFPQDIGHRYMLYNHEEVVQPVNTLAVLDEK